MGKKMLLIFTTKPIAESYTREDRKTVLPFTFIVATVRCTVVRQKWAFQLKHPKLPPF